MTQEMLDRLIGAVPPSTVDVDTVITRSRRRRRFQQVAATGSVGAAVVVAVLAGMSLTGGPQRTATAPSSTPSPVTATSTPPVGSRVEVNSAAGRNRTLDRLRTALEEATAAHAPGTAWIYMPDSPREKRTPDGHPMMWLNRDPVSFEGRSGITGKGRKGGLYVSLRPTACLAGQQCSPPAECERLVPVCEEIRTDAGLSLVRWAEKPGKGWFFYGADVQLRDGTYHLTLQAVNYFGGDGSPPVAKEPVLSRAELDAIALDVVGRFGS